MGQKLLYDFAKEMYFDERARGNKGTRGWSFISFPNSPATMASKISTKCSLKNPNQLCGRLNSLQEKQAG